MVRDVVTGRLAVLLARGPRASRLGSPQRSPPDHLASGTRRLAPAAAPSLRPLFRVGIVTGDEPEELMDIRHETVAAYKALDLVRSVDPFLLNGAVQCRDGDARVLSLESGTPT